MKSRFSHLLTLVLAGACGLLLLLILLFQLGAGRGYQWWSPETVDTLAPRDQLDRSLLALPAWSEFADVNTRPLFNEDRKPTPPAPPETLLHGDAPIPKLNVTLSGIVMTRSLRMAMIVENGKNQSSAIREGHALPGELAAWSLVAVKPRGATFKNAAGEQVELELIAKGNGQKPPPPSSPESQQQAAAAPAMLPQAYPSPGQPAQSAELRERIEARRKQLQEQAERTKQQRDGQRPKHDRQKTE